MKNNLNITIKSSENRTLDLLHFGREHNVGLENVEQDPGF